MMRRRLAQRAAMRLMQANRTERQMQRWFLQVLDATKAFKKLVTAKADVEGLPASALGLAAQQAKKEGHEAATPEEGPWLFTLDFPSYYPVGGPSLAPGPATPGA